MFFSNLFKKSGILGINARNLLYIKPFNKSKAIKLADDKIKTKQFLSARGIPVPKLYGIIRNENDLEKFDIKKLPQAFVLKPNNGYGGQGIIPIIGRKGSFFITASEEKISIEDLKKHIGYILDGRYSISNVTDTAFFEQLIVSDERIGKFSYKGLPDIRIIVHNLIPVMAMLRLPTKESKGKANLQQGAYGVGIDISKGQATYISYKNKLVNDISGMGDIRGLKIPFWDEILYIASEIQLITNLGYLAADICIDKDHGPVLLEINARAGLKIQLANMAPLRKRLEKIKGINVTTPKKGVRVAKDIFGNVVEKEIENISGKPVISTYENIEISRKNETYKLIGKIDTGRNKSIIDEKTAIKLGLLDNNKDYDFEKGTLKLKIIIKNKRIQTVAEVEPITSNKYNFIFGNRDLKEFLIDTGLQSNVKELEKENIKESEINIEGQTKQKIINTLKKQNKIEDYDEIDQKIAEIDEKIKVIKFITPLNITDFNEKFLANPTFNPVFEYIKPEIDFEKYYSDIDRISCDDSALGYLFKKKIKEILYKLKLIENIGKKEFTNYSILLYEKPTEKDLNESRKNLLNALEELPEKNKIYSDEEIKKKLENKLSEYNLEEWKVIIKDNIIADCNVNKNGQIFIKKNKLYSREFVEKLFVHEIETHIFTFENGKKQPYKIFANGLGGYLKSQEGLAIYNAEKQLKDSFKHNIHIALKILAINLALNNSFLDTYHKLLKLSEGKIESYKILNTVLKVKRGFTDTSLKGAYTKDYLYFSGYKLVKKYIDEENSYEDLYLGKINIDDMEYIKKIKTLKDPFIMPKWFKK